MSERILKALIQLFALIAFPHKDNKTRRDIVRNFLNQQLSQQIVEEYLKIYEIYYQEHVSKLVKLKKNVISRSTLTANSVKALKISDEINKELTHYQKVIVILQLLEFLKSGIEISNFEIDFVNTISQTFHITDEEFRFMYEFVINNNYNAIDKNNLLIISNKDAGKWNYRHLYWEYLKNEIEILRIDSSNLYLLKINNQAEVSINGQLLNPDRIHILTPGSSIRNNRIAPIYYSDIVQRFTSDNIPTPIRFNVSNISYRFKNRKIGIQPLSFSSQSGKLVGIMGSSGAGKSTLINILSGIYKPNSGKVEINNIDLHEHPERIEGLIGYVSQDDLLIENLTVYQNLYYNAKLCFGNSSDSDTNDLVLNILSSLGLFDIKDMKVGSPLNKKISGGQRKRLNIALELIREPSVLFLDEPTSGLSSRDSANILDLLKELALKGKLVFIVIHQPSSDIFKMFNQLLVLDTGGYLIYNGDPVESINYFKKCINQANRQESECNTCGNVNPEQVLNIISSQVIDEYGSFTPNRKIEPKEWYEKFKEEKSDLKTEKKKTNFKLPPINIKIPNRLKQMRVFIERDVLSKLSNRQYLTINLLETPILALLLASLIKYFNVDESSTQGYTFQNNPNLIVYIIMTVIISLFVGLTVSAQEIIKDRKILKREKFLNLSRLSYLSSKIVILTVISAIQTGLLVLIGNWILEVQGMFIKYWLVLFTVSVFSNLMGLIISDSLKEAVNIYILIPFLIIPQIILSGVFISYDNLNPNISNPEKVPWYGELITAKWAFEALSVNQFKNNVYEKEFYTYDKLKSFASFKKEYWIPTLQSKNDNCLKNHEISNKQALEKSLKLIHDELLKEFESNPLLFSNHILKKLNYNSYNKVVYSEIKSTLKELKKNYIKLFNTADKLLDKKKKSLTKTPDERMIFNSLKQKNYNLELERFVKKTNNIFSNKIIEHNGELIQKSDPIFKNPKNGLFSAHFLSPYKVVANQKIDTYWANLITIWLYNAILFLLLYAGALKFILNNSSEYYRRYKSNSK